MLKYLLVIVLNDYLQYYLIDNNENKKYFDLNIEKYNKLLEMLIYMLKNSNGPTIIKINCDDINLQNKIIFDLQQCVLNTKVIDWTNEIDFENFRIFLSEMYSKLQNSILFIPNCEHLAFLLNKYKNKYDSSDKNNMYKQFTNLIAFKREAIIEHEGILVLFINESFLGQNSHRNFTDMGILFDFNDIFINKCILINKV